MGGSRWLLLPSIAQRWRSVAAALAMMLVLVPVMADAAPGTTRIDWGVPPSMQVSRTVFGLAAAANGKLYAVGGLCGSFCSLVDEFDPATNTVTLKQNMPTARKELGLAAANGKLYTIGGTGSGGIVGTVEEYDPATNTWTNCGTLAPGNACKPMPTPRYGLAVATALNGKVYAAGGQTSSGAVATFEEYDPATNTWTNCGTPAPGNACQSMPAPHYALGMAAAPNGKLYAVGGASVGTTCNAGGCGDVNEYDPSTHAWTPKKPLQKPRDFLAVAATANGKLYAVGGDFLGNHVPQVEEYDIATNADWVTKGLIPTERRGLGAAVAPNGNLYVIGGQTSHVVGSAAGSLAIVEEYNPANNTWATPPARTGLTPARANLGLATGSDGRLYAIGGFTSTAVSSVDAYDPATNAWQPRTPMPGTEAAGGKRYALGVAAHPNGKIYAVGGSDGSNYLARTEWYTPATNTWELGLGGLTVARQGLGVAVGSDGLVYAAGGYNGSDSDVTESFNPTTIPWTPRHAMGTPRQLLALVATTNGTLYAIGGFHGSPLNSVEKYTIASDAWTPVAPMNQARYGLQAFLGPNGRIYAVGGQTDSTTFLNTVEEYDPGDNTWRIVGTMPTRRTSFGMALGPNKRAFAVGGVSDVSGSLAALSSVEELTFTEVPSASAGGPYSVPQGGQVQLNASGTDPEGSGLSFAWDLNNDLLYETASQSVTFSALGQPAGARTVRARVMDNRGAYAVASTTITVTAPARLAFSTQPGGAQVGQPLAPQPVVQVVDAQGRVVPAFSGPVTIAFGTNAGGGTLAGTATVNASNGVATFSNLVVNAAGNGYTLTASSPGLTSATSAVFNITAPPPAATRLSFVTQPGGASAGAPLAPQPVVRVEDTNGNVVPSFSGPITVAFGTNAGGGTLTGTTTVNAVNGIATFAGLSVTAAGSGYTLTASSPGLTSATSSPFTITAASQPGPGPQPTPAPQPAPGPQASPCNPRPDARVTTSKLVSGILVATVAPQTSASTPANSLSSIRIIRLANANVLVNGLPVTAVGTTIPLTTSPSQVSLQVVRQNAALASTVEFAVTDVCGEWKSFVGGGPGAF